MTPHVARLLRWDRAGVIISTAFRYRLQDSLSQFLWRFSFAQSHQRGCDMTVLAATDMEEESFARMIRQHITTQLGRDPTREEIAQHYTPSRVLKVPVRGKNADIQFLISCPVVSPKSVASRATRGYWAVTVSGPEQVVFLKDSWRNNVDDIEVEGNILADVKDVEGVPTLMCHGDVCEEDKNNGGMYQLSADRVPLIIREAYCTQTDRYLNGDWNMPSPLGNRPTSRIHYRQVIHEAGYTLENLAGTFELLDGARQMFHSMLPCPLTLEPDSSLLALCEVYKKHGRYHRDISSINLILFADSAHRFSQRRCLVIDWELSKRADEAREYGRTVCMVFLFSAACHVYRAHGHSCRLEHCPLTLILTISVTTLRPSFTSYSTVLFSSCPGKTIVHLPIQTSHANSLHSAYQVQDQSQEAMAKRPIYSVRNNTKKQISSATM